MHTQEMVSDPVDHEAPARSPLSTPLAPSESLPHDFGTWFHEHQSSVFRYVRFRPAVRRGQAVGTWVQFPIVFWPNPDAIDPLAFRVVDPVDGPEVSEPLDLTMIPEWRGEIALLAPVQREAGELLEAAIDDDDIVDRLGPIESILAGEPPPGSSPSGFR